MRLARWVGVACIALWAATFSACGSGSGPLTGGGIGGSGKASIKVGLNTVDGGLHVGGVAYDLSVAAIRIGGLDAPPADLRRGHVALVRGTILGSIGVAGEVVVEEVVKGPLLAKIDGNRLAVLGQAVLVDDTTVYGDGIAPASPEGLAISDLLKIWGFVLEPGVVFATRIERDPDLAEFRVVGTAENVDGALKRFDIGAQQIDHENADVSELPGGNPAVGQIVRVRGGTVLGAGGEIVATEVEVFDLAAEPDNEETEIEGFVTAVINLGEFALGEFTVQTDADTVVEGGSPGEVEAGVQVDVEGDLVAGVLTARRIRFAAAVRIEADVSSVVGEVITLAGLPGLNVTLNGLTRFEGNAAFLGDVEPGDHLRIRARVAGATLVVATRITETLAAPTVELQGPVDAFPAPADPVFAILGVGIDTSGLADGGFEGPDGAAIGRAAFFASVAPGALVRVRSQVAGPLQLIDRVRLQGPGD